MKIGIDARMYSSSFTGIGRYVHELIKNVLEIDQKNQYVVFLNPKEFEKFPFHQKNVEKVKVEAPHYSLAEQTTFLQALMKQKCDLVHFTHFNVPLLYPKKFVVTIHDLTPSFYQGKKRVSFIERMGYKIVMQNAVKRSQHIIAVSNNTSSDIQKLFHTPKEKITTVYEGVAQEFHKIEDQVALQSTKEKFHLTKPFLLYTGVWRDHKNLVNLIRAFALLKNQGLDINLVITGKDDPYYPEVKELPKELNIQESIIFTGFVSEQEIVHLYNLASVFVFPSFYEGFGLPLLESMACGTPVAASNRSSIPEICGPSACKLFDPESPENMAQIIRGTLTNEEWRKDLIQSGIERIQDFSWKKMAQEILKVYENVI